LLVYATILGLSIPQALQMLLHRFVCDLGSFLALFESESGVSSCADASRGACGLADDMLGLWTGRGAPEFCTHVSLRVVRGHH